MAYRPNNVEFTDSGIKALIAGYTREAGVRNLEREIGSVCRKIAKQVVTEIPLRCVSRARTFTTFLGLRGLSATKKQHDSQVGIVTGLAWTQVGGEILYVEALKMKAKAALF